MFNKKVTSLMLSTLLITGSLILPGNTAQAATTNGWKSDSINWYYYLKGVMKTGWIADGGSWYFLNGNGTMAKGWVKEGTNWYFLHDNGKMAIGWHIIKGKWYFFNNNGTMASNTKIGNWSASSDGAFYEVFAMGKTAVLKDTLMGTYELTINSIEAVPERNKYENSNPAEVYKITYTYKLLSKGNSNEIGLYIYGFDGATIAGKEAVSYPNTLTKTPKELTNVGDSCTAETFIAVSSKDSELTLTKQFLSKTGSDFVKFILPIK